MGRTCTGFGSAAGRGAGNAIGTAASADVSRDGESATAADRVAVTEDGPAADAGRGVVIVVDALNLLNARSSVTLELSAKLGRRVRCARHDRRLVWKR